MPGFVEKRRAVGVLPAREQPLFGEEVALGALIKLAFVLAQVFFPIGRAILRRGRLGHPRTAAPGNSKSGDLVLRPAFFVNSYDPRALAVLGLSSPHLRHCQQVNAVSLNNSIWVRVGLT